jgi:hypothetical protein
MEITMIVGWVFLISSWVVPFFIKDVSKKRLVGLGLSAIATGIFIGYLLGQLF